jgi:hypothetical protein
MKNTILLTLFAFLFISFGASAQELPIDATTQKITYSEVVQTSATLKKSTIYDRALAWAMKNKYKITKMDKANHILGCEGSIVITYPGPRVGMNDTGFLKFDIIIDAKDGRYKYTYTNFRHEGHKGKGNGGVLELAKAECGKYVLPDNGWAKIKKDTPRITEDVITDMKVSIEPQAAPAPKKENW